jgi:DNA-binding FadR family transcriptional regulator
LLQQWISSTLKIEGVAPRALDQHRKIFMAIAKRNSAAARQAMQSHLTDMARFLLEAQQETAEKRSAG